MPRTRPFAQVDVFGAEPLLGNPVAVVLDADGLDDAAMQRFAVWTNLSETTFVLPPTFPEADYRVRIFTPGGELPFAGHPTLGTAHAWLEAGGTPARDDVLVQECGVGPVELRRGRHLAFRAPALRRSGPVEAEVVQRVVRALGIELEAVVDSQWVDNGPGWVAVRLGSAQEVLAVEVDHQALGELVVGVVGLHPAASDVAVAERSVERGTSETGPRPAIEVRAFGGPSAGFLEDPVTGSLNAGLAQWLIGTGVLPPSYLAGQGARVGRRGLVEVDTVDGVLWVGGSTTTLVAGTVDL